MTQTINIEALQDRILDNILEGYPVTLLRSDGFTFKIWATREKGEERFFLRFGLYTEAFRSWNRLVNDLRRFSFSRIDF